MALKKYNAKRNFKQTAEPKGKVKKGKGELIFVIQKHHASHLHYDFRLEAEGVLKSWAVPKGPSLNPDDKRLAMMVEDHPYDYKDFEGNITEGNYGAGNVIVWDMGTYTSTEHPEDGDKAILDGIKKGNVKITLKGKKLKGDFDLVKLKNGKQENAWLLFKRKDKYVSDKDITLKDKSVLSHVTLEQLAKKYDNEKNGHTAEENKAAAKKAPTKKVVKKAAVKKATVKKVAPNKTASKKLASKKKPIRLKPMLAELSDKEFDNDDWVFEAKYDGYRALADCTGDGSVDLYSRNLLSFNDEFKPIADALEDMPYDCLLDGEVVVEDKKGVSRFQLLQGYRSNNEGKLQYYVFDILRLNDEDLTGLTLLQRKELLETLLNKVKIPNVHYSEHVVGKGINLSKKANAKCWEGIIAKRADSIYNTARRSSDWLKIKITQQEEAIICGITEPQGGRKHFGALLLGVYNGKKLEYIGNCGTGFDFDTLKELYSKFEPLFINKSPFDERITHRTKIQWMKPKLVCQVKFTEWTSEGSLRHPVYLGLRKDKKAADVKKQEPKPKVKAVTKKAAAKPSKKAASDKIKAVQVDDEYDAANTSNYEVKVGKQTLKLTNQNKVYFPKDGITKRDIVQYYDEVSSIILPYMKDRPQSMHRFPNGINDQGFYQKDVDVDKIPTWLQTEEVFSESNKEHIQYLICNNKETLLYMANLGCIEMNPWNSRIQTPENPDWMVIDLDPEAIAFTEVVKAAIEVHKFFEEHEIESYCKTSGATGLHIYVPLAAKYDYDIVKNFAQLVAQSVNERLPSTTSILRMPAKRQKKVYLDFLQNRRGQTLAAPYSVRPKPGATVSTPLDWSEVNAKLDPTKFTIKNTLQRIDKKGDLWKPVIGKGVNLDKVIKKIYDAA